MRCLILGSENIKQEKLNPLDTVKFEHGFHFTTKNEVYTGMTATSLKDFASKLETVDVDSILFHYPRGDFQKWIEDTLGEKELANRMCFVKTGISGEQLRKQLLKIVRQRINELEGPWLSRPSR
jgi:3-hydroxy-3-methylglutaryl CoA synthase